MDFPSNSNHERNRRRRQRRKAKKLASVQLEAIQSNQTAIAVNDPVVRDACAADIKGAESTSSQSQENFDPPSLQGSTNRSESPAAVDSRHETGTDVTCLQQPLTPSVGQALMFLPGNQSSTPDFDTMSFDVTSSQVQAPSDSERPAETSEADLRSLALRHSIKHTALNDLLVLLAPKFPGLPADARTLLRTPRTTEIRPCGSREYIHIGCEDGIQRCLRSGFLKGEDPSTIHLSFNIDGLPLFTGSSMHAWPILAMSLDTNDRTPFPVGIYCGLNKPEDINVYLENTVPDLKHLLQAGIQHCDATVAVVLQLVVCDMQARCFAKNVKAHNGYFGCDKCTQKGCWRGRMTYPETNAPLRTDASFRSGAQPEHHTGTSPLLQLEGLGMVSQFPIDPMHCVYLCVVRKLLRYWTQKGPRRVRLQSSKVAELSEKLNSVKPSMPRVFSRHPRIMREREHWKATECRYLLLYTAPVVLKPVLPDNLFMHYMCLHVSIRILASTSSSAEIINYAESLLVYFVEQTGHLYGQQALVYNVHALTHLTNDVRNLGPLDSFSSFPFESHLGILKRMLRSGNRPLAQLWKRLCERADKPEHGCDPLRVKLHGAHENGPLQEHTRNCVQYSKVGCELGVIGVRRPDNCILGANEKVYSVANIASLDGAPTWL